jgi:GNAT superfamily N-acetyltransferase
MLRTLLYEAIYTPPDEDRPPLSIVDTPALRRYVVGWGRADDLGMIALSRVEPRPVGAAWLRRFTSDTPGYGYLDDATPELTIALLPAYRGQGLGTRLLTELLAAAQQYPAVSLSVDASNPAVKLYQRFGFEVVGRSGRSLTMRRLCQ